MRFAVGRGMKTEFAGDTHVGMKRDHNEDALLILPEENLFVVADGMGGHSSGEVASKLAVDTIKEFFQNTSVDEDVTWPFQTDPASDYQVNRLVTAVKLANQRISEASSASGSMKGMGTTVVAACLSENRLLVAHVGDSRCYRFRKGQIDLLTEDHSLLNDFRRTLHLTAEEERNFPHKNIIVRALGMKWSVEVDVAVHEPQPGDLYLLCSDGLSGELDDGAMSKVLKHEVSVLKAAQRLVQMANRNGGRDNITAILLRVHDDDYPGYQDLTEELSREVSDDFSDTTQVDVPTRE